MLRTPVSSSSCERSFSVMNFEKDKYSNRILDKTLEDKMRIKINGVYDVGFIHPEINANEWLSGGKHFASDSTQANGKRKRTKQKIATEENSEVIEEEVIEIEDTDIEHEIDELQENVQSFHLKDDDMYPIEIPDFEDDEYYVYGSHSHQSFNSFNNNNGINDDEKETDE
jgi:hypothetical protein